VPPRKGGALEDDMSRYGPSNQSRPSIGATANEIARQANRIAIWAIAVSLVLGIVSSCLAYWQGTVRAKEAIKEAEAIDKSLDCGPIRIDSGKVSVKSCVGLVNGDLYAKGVLEFSGTDRSLWKSCNARIVVFKGNTQVRTSTSNCMPEALTNSTHSIPSIIPSGEGDPGTYRAEVTWAGSYNGQAVGSPVGAIGHAVSPPVNR
jgi:hypothetical protein